ncbi:MAG: DNA gyrase subunit A, partial [Bacilli bacterium]|nr:DNA gyrase subunit A [Bacilli bacterium]
VLKELNEIKEKFGDKRKTSISTQVLSIDDEDLIPEDDLVITLSENGYIKRMSTSEFRQQNRGGTGVKGMTVYSNDEVKTAVFSKTHTDVLFFTNLGRVYRKRGHEIPESSRTGKGIPALNLLNLEKDEKVVSILNVEEYENHYLFFCTEKGIVKRTPLEEFKRINCNGKYAITFKEDDNLFDVKVTNGFTKVCISSNEGKLCMFDENDVRAMGRTAAGVRGMKLSETGKVVGLATDQYGKLVFVVSEKGLGKLSPIDTYRLTNRGAGGVITIKITEKTGELVSMNVVGGYEDYMIITNNGQVIRSPISQVRVCGRNSQGVKIINLKAKESVSSFTIMPPADEENIAEKQAQIDEQINAVEKENAAEETENSEE